MINSYPGIPTMRNYRAVYRTNSGKEDRLDLLAKSLSSATLSATELIGPNATLVRIYENPDW